MLTCYINRLTFFLFNLTQSFKLFLYKESKALFVLKILPTFVVSFSNQFQISIAIKYAKIFLLSLHDMFKEI